MRRTKEQAAQTRRSILEAAKPLFVQHGFENVSLDEIAAAAGVKRGAVHFHFLNKFGLMTALCDEMRLPMQELAERLETDGEAAPLAALGAAISNLFARLSSDPSQRVIVRIAMAVEVSRLNEDSIRSSAAFHDRVKTTLLEIFRAAERKGQLAAPWNADNGSITLYYLLVGVISEYVRSDDDQLAREALGVVLSLLQLVTRPPASTAP